MSDVHAVIWDFGGVISSSPFEAFARFDAACKRAVVCLAQRKQRIAIGQRQIASVGDALQHGGQLTIGGRQRGPVIAQRGHFEPAGDAGFAVTLRDAHSSRSVDLDVSFTQGPAR